MKKQQNLGVEDDNVLYHNSTMPSCPYYSLTIRKSRVKDYVTKEKLDYVRSIILDCFPFSGHVDTGYHTDGRYKQLHSHSIVRIPFKGISWIDGFRVYYKPIRFMRSGLAKIHKYIHRCDWNNSIKLDQILCENYYRYHYHNY